MTDEAQAVLRKVKALRLFRDPKEMDRILNDFNRSTLDDVGPLGVEEGIKLTQEMSELGEYDTPRQ